MLVASSGPPALSRPPNRARGSASRSRTIDGVSDRPQVLIHSFENMEVRFQTLMGLIQADEQTGNAMAQANGELAKTEFARIQRQAATLSQNLRTRPRDLGVCPRSHLLRRRR